MNTLVDKVTWQGKILGGLETQEKCIVMTRRIRYLFINLSRTTVLPDSEVNEIHGFILWWNTSDPKVLFKIHKAVVRIINQIGFTEPAVWCNRRKLNRSRKTLVNYWRDHLGDIYCYYRKAT
jgi:hypothetical protein